MLLPAAFYLLTGNHSDQIALWLFRVASLAFLAGGLILFYQSLRALQLRTFSIGLTLALIGLDAKILDFSINGMETGLLIFFLALTIHGLFVAGPRQILRSSAGPGWLMWTRPDSCVYIAVFWRGGAFFPERFFRPGDRWPDRMAQSHLKRRRGLHHLYLPWFVWAWSYYGSPVPHTIVAKGANQAPMHLAGLLGSLVMFPHEPLFAYNTSLPYTFLLGLRRSRRLDGWLHLPFLRAGFGGRAVWIAPALRPHTRPLSLAYSWATFTSPTS